MDKKYLFVNILKDSFKFFGKNFKVLSKTMFLPVFLQLLGFALSICPCFYLTYGINLQGQELLPYMPVILFSLILGLVILCSGVWQYILLIPAYCLACDDYDKNLGFNYEIYKSKVANRKTQYIRALLWAALPGVIIFVSHFLVNIFCLLQGSDVAKLAILLFILIYTVIYVIYSVKISLVAQVFVFEPDKNPREVFEKSLNYMRGKNAFLAFGLMLALAVITSVAFQILSYVWEFVCGFFAAGEFLINSFDFVLSILTLFLLPLYIYTFTMLYKRIK